MFSQTYFPFYLLLLPFSAISSRFSRSPQSPPSVTHGPVAITSSCFPPPLAGAAFRPPNGTTAYHLASLSSLHPSRRRYVFFTWEGSSVAAVDSISFDHVFKALQTLSCATSLFPICCLFRFALFGNALLVFHRIDTKAIFPSSFYHKLRFLFLTFSLLPSVPTFRFQPILIPVFLTLTVSSGPASSSVASF